MARNSISRRNFIKSAAAGVAVIGAPSVIAQTSRPIRLGVTENLTGTLAYNGEWNTRAVEAAVKVINRSGGIAGRQVDLTVENCETNTQVCIAKFRNLALKRESDFVIGAVHSGINLATNPVASELKVVYFPNGTALDVTGKGGNRWIFRPLNNIRQQMKAMAIVAIKELKDRYYFAAWDYAWGRSLCEETKGFITKMGAKIIGETYIPLGTQDFGAYLSRIDPSKFDVLVLGMAGGDGTRFLQQAYEIGATKGITVIGNVEVVAGSHVKDLGPAANGGWFTTMYPRSSAAIRTELRPYDKFFRDELGVDEDGNDKKTGRPANLPYAFAAWQTLFMLKQAVEKSGWRSRDDHMKLIQALEGMQGKASREFPQGDFFIRAEDHQIFHDQYIAQIRDGKLLERARVPKEELLYPPEVNYMKA